MQMRHISLFGWLVFCLLSGIHKTFCQREHQRALHRGLHLGLHSVDCRLLHTQHLQSSKQYVPCEVSLSGLCHHHNQRRRVISRHLAEYALLIQAFVQERRRYVQNPQTQALRSCLLVLVDQVVVRHFPMHCGYPPASAPI